MLQPLTWSLIELSRAAEGGKEAKLTSVQNHLDHQRPKLPEFRHGHVAQDEAVVVLHGPEEGGHVVVLQHGPVVVQEGQARVGLHMEVVGGARVVVVVDDRREEEGEDLKV